MHASLIKTALLPLLLTCAGCTLSPEEAVKQAYLGLDSSLDKTLGLAFTGFNESKDTDVPQQTAHGAWTGSMAILGTVEKTGTTDATLKLVEGMKEYCDDGKHTYDTTSSNLPVLQLELKNMPIGTFTGSLTGEFTASDGVAGQVVLDLTFEGVVEPISGGTKVAPKSGATHITGTTTLNSATYDVDKTR